MDINTLSVAVNYGKQNKIEQWVHIFLNEEGNNIPFSNGLKLEKRFYTCPIKMPLNIIKRCCGPEDDMKFIVDEVGFNNHVQAISERLKSGWDMPPLIINFENGKFELSDGNHRYEALLKNGYNEYYVIIWTSSENDFNDFLSKGYNV
ncbi:MAG: ParB N-terminal domain-containing protein [Oscillospiraceae bacterium]